MEYEPKDDLFSGFSTPYMRLYEAEESWQRECLQPAPVTLEADESQSGYRGPDFYRFYHVLRFFASIEGFFIGELDLTGRHRERFDTLISLYNEFKADIAHVRPRAIVDRLTLSFTSTSILPDNSAVPT
ncbi:hypothetical protein D9758_008121 [Tetrapyrgos nigripes]|uniref:Uncharacterized protein n=1 Tax=Tetrapyrgos nigripes TaxID=182062 RepID=A0A8H5LPP6_9AGAR|nr:hypothetical protein D9758_008121 [Tetrapyrgos nigripes]